MKITFLGTGAGESYPGLWCRCPHCTYAREKGGKNIRANSCAVIDERLMLDIGPMCFNNAARFGVDLTQATVLLVTHPHPDHLYTRHLHWRETDESSLQLAYEEQITYGGPRFTPLPELQIYGNAFTEQMLAPLLPEQEKLHLSFHRIREGETFLADGYQVTPVRNQHHEAGFAHSYIIRREGTTMLYALDTGGYDPDMMELLRSYQYDLVIMEGTMGIRTTDGGHMSLKKNTAFRHALVEAGCLKESSRFILTHMSPHWCPPHDLYTMMAANCNMEVAYDGLTIEI